MNKSKTLLLFGLTGQGKSFLGNKLLGLSDERKFKEGRSQRSCTKDAEERSVEDFEGFQLRVIDTTGFSDNNGLTSPLLFIQMFELLGRLQSGIDLGIFCYSANNKRFNNDFIRCLKFWKAVFGQSVLKNTILVITHTDQLPDTEIEYLETMIDDIKDLLFREFETDFKIYQSDVKNSLRQLKQDILNELKNSQPILPSLSSVKWKNFDKYKEYLKIPEFQQMISIMSQEEESRLKQLIEQKKDDPDSKIKKLKPFVELMKEFVGQLAVVREKEDFIQLFNQYIENSSHSNLPLFKKFNSELKGFMEKKPSKENFIHLICSERFEIFLKQEKELNKLERLDNEILICNRNIQTFKHLQEGNKCVQSILFTFSSIEDFQHKLDQYITIRDTTASCLYSDIYNCLVEFDLKKKGEYKLKCSFQKAALEYLQIKLAIKIELSIKNLFEDHVKEFSKRFSLTFPEIQLESSGSSNFTFLLATGATSLFMCGLFGESLLAACLGIFGSVVGGVIIGISVAKMLVWKSEEVIQEIAIEVQSKFYSDQLLNDIFITVEKNLILVLQNHYLDISKK